MRLCFLFQPSVCNKILRCSPSAAPLDFATSFRRRGESIHARRQLFNQPGWEHGAHASNKALRAQGLQNLLVSAVLCPAQGQTGQRVTEAAVAPRCRWQPRRRTWSRDWEGTCSANKRHTAAPRVSGRSQITERQ